MAHWHGEVLAKVLAVHGIETGAAHIAAVRRRLGWRDRVAPIGQALIANVVGEDFVAVHMTWGAMNEWSAYAGYARLAELEQHPTLAELLPASCGRRRVTPPSTPARPATGWPPRPGRGG